MKTINQLLAGWHGIPSGLHQILYQAGYDRGINMIRRPGSAAGQAPARWIDNDWRWVDLSGPFDRPVMRRVRTIEVTGPCGVVTGEVMA